jgi:uncharacterized membrane protein YkvA (DUF1232 family)
MSPEFEFRDPNAVQVPAVLAKNARIVERHFWKKLLRLVGHIPFAEDLAAAYFCVVDPATPGRVRGVVLAALAWFVIPASVLPEFLLVFGFSDDAAVGAIVVAVVRKHIRERHYIRARAALGIPEPDWEYE